MRARSGIALLLLSLACFGCERQSPSGPPGADTQPGEGAAARDCKVVMGWNPWPPYHYRDVGGEVSGLEVEIVSALMRIADCRLDFAEDEWRDLLGMLRDGDIDLLSGATRTAEREQYALFSDPYRSERFVLYVRTGEAEKHPGEDLEALLARGFRVGLTDEYIYGDRVSKLRDHAEYADQFLPEAVGAANYIKLLNFEIDGFLEDPVVASDFLRRYGLGEQISAHAISFETGQVSLMFSRRSVVPELVVRINEALQRIVADGTYEQIMDRYMLVEPARAASAAPAQGAGWAHLSR